MDNSFGITRRSRRTRNQNNKVPIDSYFVFSFLSLKVKPINITFTPFPCFSVYLFKSFSKSELHFLKLERVGFKNLCLF